VQVIRGFSASATDHVALTIGNFDGVHRGHRAMLRRLIEAAEDLGLPPAVLTFYPPPREFFAKGAAPPRLSSVRTKLEQFAACGVARVHVARFDARLAALTAIEFIEAVLVRQLRTRWVLVGDDFRFGRGRAGDLALLRASARTFSVEAMATVSVAGERVSSTAIRAALAKGELEHAAQLLGRPYSITGRVAHGDKLGRNLGFPTANLPLRHKPPLAGIFAVRVHGLGPPRSGVASRTLPLSGARAPARQRSRVDLPEPLSPTMPRTSPGCSASDSARHATMPPNALVRAAASRIGWARALIGGAAGNSRCRSI